MKARLALIAGALLAITGSLPAYAADTTPPTRPTGLIPCPPPSAPGQQYGYASICWQPATDDAGPVAKYELYVLEATGFRLATTTTGTIAGTTGVRGRGYTLYVMAVDLSGNRSAPSDFITVTATTGMQPSPTPTPSPLADETPPSQPGNVRDNCVFDFPGAGFCWNASTDDVGVTAYDVYRESPLYGWVKAGTTTQTFFIETGLVTGQYYNYTVVARDAAGNVSRPSAVTPVLARPGFPTPTPTPPTTCEVTYNTSGWGTGMSSWMTLKNTGTTPVAAWTLRFTFPDAGQEVTQGYSATWSQAGPAVTAANLPWNAEIRPGAVVHLGFTGAHAGANPKPSAFTLNGSECAVG
ncbi:hypothetical protein GT755_29280 [Herbidospora sp. NEAU-GS84]|uniref:CBM2 domain-containing protein n=1 Tax=Herbidospora solisilvae TaxID=2696284 RepID=A0A7C9JFZ5_9ACTN|nr:cellulose binding domain-containing protein [Herbidospora solisilvae]NAS25761.1 hypothetical protein [Herbidospora solisilvae]